MPSSFRKMHKLGGDHLPTSTVTVWRSAAINVLWVPIISFNLLWRSVVPRGGNLTYNGDPRVGKLTFENLKMSNFPWVTRPPPILGQTIDRCITQSSLKRLFHETRVMSSEREFRCGQCQFHCRNKVKQINCRPDYILERIDIWWRFWKLRCFVVRTWPRCLHWRGEFK